MWENVEYVSDLKLKSTKYDPTKEEIKELIKTPTFVHGLK